jgi:hypothetical protein
MSTTTEFGTGIVEHRTPAVVNELAILALFSALGLLGYDPFSVASRRRYVLNCVAINDTRTAPDGVAQPFEPARPPGLARLC